MTPMPRVCYSLCRLLKCTCPADFGDDMAARTLALSFTPHLAAVADIKVGGHLGQWGWLR